MKKGKYLKDAGEFTAASVGMGVGSTIITRAGGDPTSIGKLSSAMPTVGKIKGAGYMIGALEELGKAAKGKKK